MSGVDDALDGFEDAAHMLLAVISAPSVAEPLPSWWHPIARHIAVVEHAEALARWAEAVDQFADELREAANALAAARSRAELDEALGYERRHP